MTLCELAGYLMTVLQGRVEPPCHERNSSSALSVWSKPSVIDPCSSLPRSEPHPRLLKTEAHDNDILSLDPISPYTWMYLYLYLSSPPSKVYQGFLLELEEDSVWARHTARLQYTTRANLPPNIAFAQWVGRFD